MDTSVWIDFFRKKKTVQTDFLKECVANDKALAYTGMILTEILQGMIKKSDIERLFGTFSNLTLLPLPFEGYLLAADIYRRARQRGKTVRSTLDCLIAVCAILHNAELLENDRDFKVIAAVSDLTLCVGGK